MGITYSSNIARTYEKIAEATVVSTGSNLIDITSISQAYTDLIVVCSTSRNAPGAGARGVDIRFNGDSGSNQYGYCYLQYANGTPVEAGSNQYSSGQGGNAMDRSSGGTGYVLYINDYKGTGNQKNYISQISRFQGGAFAYYQYINRWKSTSAINRISIAEPFEGFVAGDRVVIYGILGA
jgi:hypothetical protein